MSQAGDSDKQQHVSSKSPKVGESSGSAVDNTRRQFLLTAVAGMGVVGAGFAAWPFIASWRPSARAKAIGGPITVDLSSVESGQQVTVVWRGQPVWILRRTPQMLELMQHAHWLNELRDPNSAVETQQPSYAQNPTRSLRPEIFVTIGLCTHLGCVPMFEPEAVSRPFESEWMGGYFCPCHGSKFDLAGRVTKNVPAPTNLVVPPYRFLSDNMLEIGLDDAVI